MSQQMSKSPKMRTTTKSLGARNHKFLSELIHNSQHTKFVNNITTNPSRDMTSSSSLVSNPLNLERNPRTRPWNHSPVVLAMLSDNRMRNCDDVREIFTECLATNSKDRICNTAAQYFSRCAQSYEDNAECR